MVYFFAHYQYLWLLLLVPAFPVLYAVVRTLRRRRIRKFGDEALVDGLMPSWSGAKGWIRVILFSLAFLFFVLGLARPQIGAKLSERKTKGAEVIICLDVSNSMLAQDYSPNRLERAKLAISRIVDRLQEDRIGLIVFAGSSESEKSRAVIVITDGENHEDDPVEAARTAAEMGVRVYTIGVGSAQGQPIPMDGELLRDRGGEIVVTRLDEEALREIAQAGNGAYVHAGNEEFGLNPVIDDIRKMEAEEFNSVVFEEYDERYMYFFGIALALLVLEMLIGERRPKKKLFE